MHYQSVYEETLRYLQYQQDKKEADDKRFIVETEDPPLQPEPLGILYMMRNIGTPYWGGGLDNQPVLLMHEINACLRAENEISAAASRNLQAQMEYMLKMKQMSGG